MGNILVKLWQYSKPENTGIADLKFWGEKKKTDSVILYMATFIYKYNIQ